MASIRSKPTNATTQDSACATAAFFRVGILLVTLLLPVHIASASGTEDLKTPPGSPGFQMENAPASGAVQPILLAQLSLPLEQADVSARGPAARSGRPPQVQVDESLIDTLTRMPPPLYVSPARSTSPGWSRGFGAVRSGRLGSRIEAVAPADHTGLSFSAAPRLWWRLDSRTEYAIQITIVDESAIDPLFRVHLAGPHPAGLDAIDLSQHGVQLKPDIDYRWFVTLVIDSERPSRNPLSEGAIRVLGESDPRRVQVSDAPLPTRGHRLARLGVWYDAYDFFSELAAENPGATAIARHRDRLMETVSRE